MSNRFFSSHYILLPGGQIGRWPIIHFDDHGTIIQIESDFEKFKERPGLEFQSGMMIPAFIDIAPTNIHFNPDVKLINRHFSRGTIILGVSDVASCEQSGFPLLVKSLDDGSSLPQEAGRDAAQVNTPLFERVRSRSGFPISKLAHICEQASEAGRFRSLGQLATGKSPGVLLLKNFDNTNWTLLPHSEIKWLIKPHVDVSNR
ncbi:hypothetical protein [Alkalitalea saponilacus]|uniref:Uncharacterized protein n=1 Tax=Alkalitalea saponilacus TaxID=889453 RepID=A0A1T5FR89_9BACT|nr:hypothetical protein [Alkalitalea saponilacus]ASB49471.1 hypothetical protein CDL62_10135 [Alkalitalea saponilacus]SKB98705.1 hypothetical protein SAMN03080601_01661 [Alkalitalea saponilacus]